MLGKLCTGKGLMQKNRSARSSFFDRLSVDNATGVVDRHRRLRSLQISVSVHTDHFNTDRNFTERSISRTNRPAALAES